MKNSIDHLWHFLEVAAKQKYSMHVQWFVSYELWGKNIRHGDDSFMTCHEDSWTDSSPRLIEKSVHGKQCRAGWVWNFILVWLFIPSLLGIYQKLPSHPVGISLGIRTVPRKGLSKVVIPHIRLLGKLILPVEFVHFIMIFSDDISKLAISTWWYSTFSHYFGTNPIDHRFG